MYKQICLAVLTTAIVLATGCNNSNDDPLDPDIRKQAFENVGASQVITGTTPNLTAQSDVDEPINATSLALIDTLVGRLKSGADIADLMSSPFSFSYLSYSECAAVTSGRVDGLLPQYADNAITIALEIDWQNPDCEEPPSRLFDLSFEIKNTVAEWKNITAAAEDHNFDVFYISEPGSIESFMVEISKDAEVYKISHIEYRHYYVD